MVATDWRHAVSMDEVRRKHTGHWFDKDTMRFFRSRVGSVAYESNDGAYRFFVSSEKHEYSGGEREGYAYHSEPRLYSVHVQRVADGSINTVGEFQGYRTRSAAENVAKGYALDPADACSLITGNGGRCPIHNKYHEKRED